MLAPRAAADFKRSTVDHISIEAHLIGARSELDFCSLRDEFRGVFTRKFAAEHRPSAFKFLRIPAHIKSLKQLKSEALDGPNVANF